MFVKHHIENLKWFGYSAFMSSKEYRFLEIERKWRARWEPQHVVTEKDRRPKYYCLDMFPYPSGSGLHVGHWRGYVLSDVWSRFQTLKGFKVLHPMGWDAFGLPAENDAIKKKIHPKKNTEDNIHNIRRQLKEIGAMFDWSREVNTTDPSFYRWTQWIFLQFYKKGLAYRKLVPINWCPRCRAGLANEEVVAGKCERCEAEVTKKELNQWMLKITAYADRLLKDLESLDWPEKVKRMQTNWIGRSEGGEIVFELIGSASGGSDGKKYPVTVFTTRADTLCGATYMVLAPEHPLVLKICDPKQKKKVESYIQETAKEKEIDRTSSELAISGVDLGIFAINPVNQKKIPVWISDYVLMAYGTGAIMAVPAHDERDFRFAKKFGLPIIDVILSEGKPKEAYTGEGKLINSGEFNGIESQIARKKIVESLENKGAAKEAVHYKLRDWVFSRQRYWGEPIPIIYCEKCGELPLREEDLPLLLPDVERYQPAGTGESPLATISKWVNTTCHKCGGTARRETDTMPQWAGSSWYFLRYASPHYHEGPFDPKAVRHWMPVDLYVGGVEHAILHLLYARFFTKFLFDIGSVDFQEPFLKLFNQGMVCRHSDRTKKVEKMSKSKMNVVNPDEIVEKYGTDTLRLFELFIGPPEQEAEWSDQGIEGIYRFLRRSWQWVLHTAHPDVILSVQREGSLPSEAPDPLLDRERHILIKKVTERLEGFHFNVVISAFMEFMNVVTDEKNRSRPVDQKLLDDFLILLSPFAPHIAEELWESCGHKESIFKSEWPTYDPKKIESQTMTIVIQINGKLRADMEVDRDSPVEKIKEMARSHLNIVKQLQGKSVIKEIYVPRKLINFVVKN